MPLLADRVQESTSTIGTGTLTLAGAVTGYRTFNASFTNGDVVYYTIDDGAGNWEVGYGTVGTGTLTRTVVLESSNANALVSFASGVKRVFNTATAVSILNASTGGTVNGALTVTGATTLATSLTGILQAISGAVSTITIGSGLTFAAGTLASTGSGTVTSVSGTGTVSGLTLSGTVTTSGSLTLGGTLNLSSPPAIGGTAPAAGNFTTLGATGDVTLGDASGDTVTFNAATVTLNNSTTIASASTKTLTITSAATGAINGFNIGATTAGTGAFTTLSASSTVSGTGFSNYLLSPPAIGTTAPAAGKFTDLTSTGNTTIGDASTDTFTVYPQTISLINSTAITAASTKTLTLNGGAGSNGLVLDASNNVGIGAASSGGKFEVASVGSGVVLKQNATGAATYYVFDNTVETGGKRWRFGYTGASGTSVGQFAIYNQTDNTLGWVLDASGNLGIGAASPAGVRLNISDVKAKIQVTSTTGTNAGYITFSNTGGNVYYGVDNSAGTDFSAAYAGVMWNGGAYPLVFGTSNVEKMRLDASGNLGVGTSSPTSGIQLGSPTINASGTSNTLRIYRGGVAGQYAEINDTGAEFTLNSVNGGGGGFGFFNDGVRKVTIDSSGNLLVGTTSVSQTADIGIKITPAGDGANYPRISLVTAATTNGQNNFISGYSTAVPGYRFYIGAGGTISAISTTISAISDQRLKENIRDLDNGLATILALKPRKFDWKEGKGKDIKNDRGFIAQEFEQVLPDLIDQWKDEPPEGEEPYKAVRADLIPILVKAIQELSQEIETLKQKVNA